MIKKLLLVVLLITMCVSVIVTDAVLAKAKFGNWDRWDEQLPLWDNKDWVWKGETCCSRIISFPPSEDAPVWVWEKDHWAFTTITYPPIFKDVFYLFLVRLSFLENEHQAHQASVIFLSLEDKDTDDSINKIKDNLANAEFAIVAFPPKRGKVIIRAYENKNGLFQFFEKWTEPFKNETIVFPEKKTKFTQKYDDWLDNQFKQQNTEERTRQWLEWVLLIPRLIILDEDKKSFFISIGTASIDRRAPILFFY